MSKCPNAYIGAWGHSSNAFVAVDSCEARLLEALFDVKAVHFTPVRLVLSALLDAELPARLLPPLRALELLHRRGARHLRRLREAPFV